eukprot:scaffold395642_cov44-Prasinocladus_malaysianus.AAC.1
MDESLLVCDSLPAASAMGGSDALPGRYPYMARLLHPDFGTPNGPANPHICGGVFLGDSLVLTAAHCLQENSSGHPKPVVRIGDDASYVDRETIDTMVHPKWTQSGSSVFAGHDLALIFMNQSVPDVLPARWWNQPAPSEMVLFESLWALGWGQQGTGSYNPTAPLQQVELPYLTNPVCEN